MADPVVSRLLGKMVDPDSGEPVGASSGKRVEFMLEARPDPLLSEGGLIEKRHPKVKEIRKLEQENLALLRASEPFTEEEPQPTKDQSPAAQRKYQEAHKEWDVRREAHEADLEERARLLRDHHEFKDLFVVAPAGRPIHVELEYIRIMNPGDKDNIRIRPVRPQDKIEFADDYRRWKAGQSQARTGTPLEQWPGVSKAQVKDLAYFNVRTVEDLAQVSDDQIQKIGPLTALRRKAQDWLKTARGMAPVEEARAESKRLRDELETVKAQMAELVKASKQQNQARQ